MKFSIYQVVNPTFKDAIIQEREYVATIEASTPGEAFKKSQNLDETWNKMKPCRSTSIGDIIVDEKYNKLLVCGIGFKDVTNLLIV